jgi:hypothetical protein
MTEYACQHRFRPLKVQADFVREAVARNVDCKTLSVDLPNGKNGTFSICLF